MARAHRKRSEDARVDEGTETGEAADTGTSENEEEWCGLTSFHEKENGGSARVMNFKFRISNFEVECRMKNDFGIQIPIRNSKFEIRNSASLS